MSLYPSLEDMKVDQMLQVNGRKLPQSESPRMLRQISPLLLQAQANLLGGSQNRQEARPSSAAAAVYPGLADYMGLELSESVIRANMPEYLDAQRGLQNHQVVSREKRPNKRPHPFSFAGQRASTKGKQAEAKNGGRKLASLKGIFLSPLFPPLEMAEEREAEALFSPLPPPAPRRRGSEGSAPLICGKPANKGLRQRDGKRLSSFPSHPPAASFARPIRRHSRTGT